MLNVLRSRVYLRLFAAQVVSLVGTGLATVALGLLAHDVAGGHAGVVLGGIFTVKMIAYVFVAPLMNAALVRLPRRNVMVGADIVRVVIALCLPFAGQPWQIFFLVFVLQSASATFTPTFQSVIPIVLPDEDDYTQALSLSRLAYDLESIASPMLAALLLLVMQSNTLFLGTALGFAGSAALVLSAALPKSLGLSDPREGPIRPFGARARSGIAHFARRPGLRPILALNLVSAAAVSLVLVHTVVIVRSDIGLDQSAVAVFLAINGAGSMTAALVLPRVLRRVDERTIMLPAAGSLAALTALAGVALLSASGGPEIVILAALWYLIGLAWSAVETPIGRIIRRETPPDELSAAFAAQFSLSHACWLICYPLAGALGLAGLSTTAFALAGLATAAAVLATLLWRAVPEPEMLEVMRADATEGS
ncbi:MFS transporter [Brooklawnia sp.]|uniref:MFS transporter n=1 Tax=Brooklawnia sp. TaxID=2699740 RepID=UPI00311DA7B5